ncbi:hypothetical protein [Mycobacterium sp. E2497]|uniref:hypothetical protein n=1 Tax=Mycobacterium sp. E2497 TaxID=1834135 RepID=UPI0007FBB49F|nr:hypothetical protein [Mycobacterium sp. E2497]OBI13677.1 hypothetical protein A5713_26460 [Mycobacterium sp. E2497]
MPEIVCGLGGWLFDHATAGWDVRARIETVTGERALRILGAEMSDFGETLSLSYWTEAPDVVAVSVRACLQHKPIRQGILHALENFRTDVLLWGDHCPSSLLRAHHAVPVHCSLAARAFADIARAATDGGCVSSPATLFRLTPGRAHPVRRRRHGVRPSWASGHTNGQGAHA